MAPKPVWKEMADAAPSCEGTRTSIAGQRHHLERVSPLPDECARHIPGTSQSHPTSRPLLHPVGFRDVAVSPRSDGCHTASPGHRKHDSTPESAKVPVAQPPHPCEQRTCATDWARRQARNPPPRSPQPPSPVRASAHGEHVRIPIEPTQASDDRSNCRGWTSLYSRLREQPVLLRRTMVPAPRTTLLSRSTADGCSQ